MFSDSDLSIILTYHSFFAITILVKKFSCFDKILTKPWTLNLSYDVCRNGRQPSQQQEECLIFIYSVNIEFVLTASAVRCHATRLRWAYRCGFFNYIEDWTKYILISHWKKKCSLRCSSEPCVWEKCTLSEDSAVSSLMFEQSFPLLLFCYLYIF